MADYIPTTIAEPKPEQKKEAPKPVKKAPVKKKAPAKKAE